MWTLRSPAMVAASAVLVLAGAAPAQANVSQLAGNGGCIGQDEDGCAPGKGLVGGRALAISPDGKSLYVAAGGEESLSNAIATFSRDAAGRLSQTGCISDTGTDGTNGGKLVCTDGDALEGLNGVAVSPDGRNVYATAASDSAAGPGNVISFSRDPATGALTEIQCIKDYVRDGRCEDGFALAGARGVALSPDGRFVYVTARSANAVVAFARDPDSGRLSEAGCVSSNGSDGACVAGPGLFGASAVAASPDGKNLYAIAANSETVVSFSRDSGTGALTETGCTIANTEFPPGFCVQSKNLDEPAGLAVLPDGSAVYTTNDANVTLLARDSAGTLRDRGCVSAEDEGDPDNELDDCKTFAGLDLEPVGIAISPDGRSFFTVEDGVLAAFSRDASGRIDLAGCAASADDFGGGCTSASGLLGGTAAVVSPDGRNVYVAGFEAVSAFAFSAGVSTSRARVGAHGVVRVRVSCPRAAQRCLGKLALTRNSRARRAMAASSSFALRPGTSRLVRVRLGHRATRLLGRKHRARAVAVLVDRRGMLRPATRNITLVSPRRAR